MKKEQLNEKDIEKVSGGTALSCDDPTKGAYIQQTDGTIFDVYCDACGERISGWPKPVFVDFSSVGLGAKIYCLKCFLALNDYVKNNDYLDSVDIKLDINPDFDPSK